MSRTLFSRFIGVILTFCIAAIPAGLAQSAPWDKAGVAGSSGDYQLQQHFSAFPAAKSGSGKPYSNAVKSDLFLRFIEWRNADTRLTTAD